METIPDFLLKSDLFVKEFYNIKDFSAYFSNLIVTTDYLDIPKKIFEIENNSINDLAEDILYEKINNNFDLEYFCLKLKKIVLFDETTIEKLILDKYLVEPAQSLSFLSKIIIYFFQKRFVDTKIDYYYKFGFFYCSTKMSLNFYNNDFLLNKITKKDLIIGFSQYLNDMYLKENYKFYLSVSKKILEYFLKNIRIKDLCLFILINNKKMLHYKDLNAIACELTNGLRDWDVLDNNLLSLLKKNFFIKSCGNGYYIYEKPEKLTGKLKNITCKNVIVDALKRYNRAMTIDEIINYLEKNSYKFAKQGIISALKRNKDVVFEEISRDLWKLK